MFWLLGMALRFSGRNRCIARIARILANSSLVIVFWLYTSAFTESWRSLFLKLRKCYVILRISFRLSRVNREMSWKSCSLHIFLEGKCVIWIEQCQHRTRTQSRFTYIHRARDNLRGYYLLINTYINFYTRFHEQIESLFFRNVSFDIFFIN